MAGSEEDARFGLRLRQHECLLVFARAEHGRDSGDERKHLQVGERLGRVQPGEDERGGDRHELARE